MRWMILFVLLFCCTLLAVLWARTEGVLHGDKMDFVKDLESAQTLHAEQPQVQPVAVPRAQPKEAKMNFVKDLETAHTSLKQHEQAAVAWGKKLEAAMGFDSHHTEMADEHETCWEVGDYFICARRFPYFQVSDKWVTTMIAVPRECGTHNVGYANVAIREPDADKWFYMPSGTATIIYPYPEEQERILTAIRNAQ